MFTSSEPSVPTTTTSATTQIEPIQPPTTGIDWSSHTKVDQLLEKEKQHNKTESWNKLDKTVKIQKLHGFAEKYGREHSLAIKEIKSLKLFFNDCLEKNKLQKTKEVIYDKTTHEIQSIPSLFLHPVNRNFTLKIMDPKRVSTLKSLTPKRTSITNREEDSNISDEKLDNA